MVKIMKTIGIITYHHYYNYGTMLQALALQEKVEQLGYQAELIDFIYASVAKCSIGIKQIIHQRFLMRKPYNEICKGINLTHQYLYKLINEELEKKVNFVEMERVKKILIQWQARGQNK